MGSTLRAIPDHQCCRCRFCSNQFTVSAAEGRPQKDAHCCVEAMPLANRIPRPIGFCATPSKAVLPLAAKSFPDLPGNKSGQ